MGERGEQTEAAPNSSLDDTRKQNNILNAHTHTHIQAKIPFKQNVQMHYNNNNTNNSGYSECMRTECHPFCNSQKDDLYVCVASNVRCMCAYERIRVAEKMA